MDPNCIAFCALLVGGLHPGKNGKTTKIWCFHTEGRISKTWNLCAILLEDQLKDIMNGPFTTEPFSECMMSKFISHDPYRGWRRAVYLTTQDSGWQMQFNGSLRIGAPPTHPLAFCGSAFLFLLLTVCQLMFTQLTVTKQQIWMTSQKPTCIHTIVDIKVPIQYSVVLKLISFVYCSNSSINHQSVWWTPCFGRKKWKPS